MKGEKGCESGHVDDKVLYQVLVHVFNAMIENKHYFVQKWWEGLKSEALLQRYKGKYFIEISTDAKPIIKFDVDLYLPWWKRTVYDDDRLVVSLLEGTEVECLKEN